MMTILLVGACVACIAAGLYVAVVLVRDFAQLRNKEL